MYRIINNYVNNGNDNGLILIDEPTGSGKTYTSLKYIEDELIRGSTKRYFFVTSMKKNLPYEELKENLKKAGHPEIANDKIINIDSNIDSLINGWSKEVEKEIPYAIKKTKEYKEICENIRWLNEHKDDKTKAIRATYSAFKKMAALSEYSFHTMLERELSRRFFNREQKLNAIKTDKEWQWIAKIYPSVFTIDARVIFLSMDKFLLSNTTIVEKTYNFLSSDIVKDSIVFIDEFDATKETILKSIIDKGLKEKVDFIQLFKEIYRAFHSEEFPQVLLTPSYERIQGEYRNQSLKGIIDGVKEKAEEIFDKYSLQYKHRTSEKVDSEKKNFLFQDYKFHTVLSEEKSYIATKCNEKEKLNLIDFSNTKENSTNIQFLLGQLRGYVSFFQGAVHILALNYQQYKNETRKDGEDVYTYEAAIRSVLNLFEMSRENIDYITSQILLSAGGKSEREDAPFDLTFYENGFRYFAFENDYSHDMQSLIMMYSFQKTPEKVLTKLCERAKVIGISATASLPSAIGNYDLDYVETRLKDKYCKITEEERKELQDNFDQVQNYKDIDIEVELLGTGDEYTINSWKTIFGNDEVCQKAFSLLENKHNDDYNNYNKKRYYRICLAFARFLDHDDIKSFLCVLTKHPKNYDNMLDKMVLEELFNLIVKARKVSFSVNDDVHYLDGEDYETKKKDMSVQLANGKKIFAISVYQTIGAGQNLQYKIPAALEGKLIKINNVMSKNEKDFDAIYLDQPTNLVVNFQDNMQPDEFVKYIYQMEYLQEAAEITKDIARKNIKTAFATFISGEKPKNFGSFTTVRDRRSVVLLSTRYIIQAIGRLCRTNNKQSKIYVYADDRIAENLDTTVVEDRILNHEFRELVSKVKEVAKKPEYTVELESKAEITAIRVRKDISNILDKEWTNKKVDKWGGLRDLTLRIPCATDEDRMKNFAINSYYVKLPQPNDMYYYKEENDFNNVTVNFGNKAYGYKVVSEESSKLHVYMSIPGVKDYFEEKGWATSFKKTDYLMAPTLFNNIYKGALGEVVGRYIFEKNLDIKLEDINELEFFELFDFKIPGLPVYVDFKNWHDQSQFDKDETIAKIQRKAEICGCKCVLVINIHSAEEWNINQYYSNDKGLRIVTIPSLVMQDGEDYVLKPEAATMIKGIINGYKN